MNILFVHDHRFKEEKSLFFSNGCFPSTIWKRYITVFDSITVVGRNDGLLGESDKGYILSSIDGVDFKLFPNISNLKSLFFGNSVATEACQKLVAKHDAIIARLPSRLGQLFVNEAIRQGKPYALEIVGCPLDALWNYGTWKGKILAPFAAMNLKKMVAKSPFSLYVTESFLQKRYPCLNGQTVFCSNVEIPSVDDAVLVQRLEKIKKPHVVLIFGLIGNYSSEYKGIDVAIRALALADKELPKWQLQVLGTGNSKKYQELAQQLGIGSKVNFIGSLPSGQPVFDWLDFVDIYLQPSFTEGLPRALVEAMSRGCPALASSVGGIPELLDNNQMIIAGDYVKLAELIKKLEKNHEHCIQVSEQNFIKAKNYYMSALDQRRTDFWCEFHDFIKL